MKLLVPGIVNYTLLDIYGTSSIVSLFGDMNFESLKKDPFGGIILKKPNFTLDQSHSQQQPVKQSSQLATAIFENEPQTTQETDQQLTELIIDSLIKQSISSVDSIWITLYS